MVSGGGGGANVEGNGGSVRFRVALTHVSPEPPVGSEMPRLVLPLVPPHRPSTRLLTHCPSLSLALP